MNNTSARTCAFGDLEAGVWGIACVAAEGGGGARLGTIGGPQLDDSAPRLEGDDASDPWYLSGERFEVTLSPASPAAELTLDQFGLRGCSQLCHVEGRALIDGSEVTLDCFGQRGVRSVPSADGAELGSLREVAAWFGPDDGLLVLAARDDGASGHDRDALGGLVFEDGQALSVAEPRLSTTYAPDGAPLRASVELWLEPPGEVLEDDPENAPPQEFPRRAAGEVLLPAGNIALGALELRADLFRWHFRGRNGAGVYVLARPR